MSEYSPTYEAALGGRAPCSSRFSVRRNTAQAARVAIGVWIGTDGPPGVPAASAEEVALLYWDLHTRREEVESVFTV